jgi:hypothetical protein
MHKKSNTFRKLLAALAMFGLVASGAVVLAPAAIATPFDAAGGLSFIRVDSDAEGYNPDVLEDAVVGDSYTYVGVMTGVDAKITVTDLLHSSGAQQTLLTEKIDDYDSDTDANKWIITQFERTGNAPDEQSVKKFRIDFFATGTTTPATLNNLKVNLYDIDNSQTLEVNNVLNYIVTSDTIVTERKNLGDDVWRFTAKNVNASNDFGVPSRHGAGRVQVNFKPTNSLTFAIRYHDDGSVAMDFTHPGLDWKDSSDEPIAAPATSTASVDAPNPLSMSLTGTAALGTDMTVSFLNAATVVGDYFEVFVCPNRLVRPYKFSEDSLAGCTLATFWSRNDVAGYSKQTSARTMTWKLSTVREYGLVATGGSQYLMGNNEPINIDPPQAVGGWCAYQGQYIIVHDSDIGPGTGGLHSNWSPAIVCPSANGSVAPAPAAVGTKKATLIVGGFAHNSRVLTARMQARIERWLDKNSDLTTLACTGFTSLPRRTADVKLSRNRGITACNFSKKQRSELETSVSPGKQDPRPGSNVRRVRLVLTP